MRYGREEDNASPLNLVNISQAEEKIGKLMQVSVLNPQDGNAVPAGVITNGEVGREAVVRQYNYAPLQRVQGGRVSPAQHG